MSEVKQSDFAAAISALQVTVEAMQTTMASLQTMISQNNAGPVRSVVENEAEWQRSLEESARHKAWCGLTQEQRNHYVIAKSFRDRKQFWAVSIPGDKQQPLLVVPANSQEEAAGRYNRICGIRSNEKPHVIEPSTREEFEVKLDGVAQESFEVAA